MNINYYYYIIILFDLLILIKSKSINLKSNDSKEDKINNNDIMINLISTTLGGGHMKNQITFDVSSSKSINNNLWNDNIKIEITKDNTVICNNSINKLLTNDFICDIDNHILEPGINIFTITIYTALTNEIYFEKDTYFYFDGANDLYITSYNNDKISIWERFDINPNHLIIASSSLTFASLLTVLTLNKLKSSKLKSNSLDGDIINNNNSNDHKGDDDDFDNGNYMPEIINHYNKNIKYYKRKSFFWRLSTLICLGLLTRHIGLGLITNTLVSIPSILISSLPFNNNKKITKNNDIKEDILLDRNGKVAVYVITLPDGRKVVKSSIWWLEWIGTGLMCIYNGHPRFLAALQKFINNPLPKN